MSKYPHLTAKTVHKHPATITNIEQLQPGAEVALGYIVPTIGRRERAAQALMGAINHPEGIRAGWNSKKAFNHTPNWGIVLQQLVKVQSVTHENEPRIYCVSLRSEFAMGPTKARLMGFVAKSIEEVPEVAYKLLPEMELNDEGEYVEAMVPQTLLEKDFGLIRHEPQRGYEDVAFDLSKIKSN